MTAERIGFYGGTFDPPHKGHAAAAAAFAAAVRPDRLYIIPNALPPLKDGRVPAPPADRLAMAALAFPGWTVCDYEIRSGGVSYTCKTVEHLRELHPGGALYMLVGTDQLMQLERWRRPESLLRAVVVCVALRRGGEESRAAAKAEALRRSFGADVRFVPFEPVEVSSTEVRAALAQGRPHPLLDDGVARYIREKGLYR